MYIACIVVMETNTGVGLFWTMDFYFDIIQMFVSWEWQQLLDSYLETQLVILCYAKPVAGTVHRIYLSTTKCTSWYYKRSSKTEYTVINISAFTYNEKKNQPVSLICLVF